MSNFKGRPAQPKCDCGKALYKRMDAGPVKTSDPYAWCRNRACAKHNKPQAEGSPHAPIGGVAAIVDPDALRASVGAPRKGSRAYAEAANKRAREIVAARPPLARKAKPAHVPATVEAAVSEAVEMARKAAAKVAPAEGEPPAVQMARARIKKAIESVKQEYTSNVIGLALALVAQETGSHEAANALIRDYKLDAAYGIQPR